jgi:hypothetical protein
MEEVAEIPEPTEAPPALEGEAPAPAPKEDAPAKRRGRPPGSRNKPKIVLEAPKPPEPTPEAAVPEASQAAPEAPVVMKKPRAKKAIAAKETAVAKAVPEPNLPTQTPHETFIAAMTAWQHMAALDRQARGNHYNRLVDAMFH